MADWNEFLKSDDFRAYRRMQSEVVSGIISHAVEQAVSGNQDVVKELKGSLAVIHALLRLPEELTTDEQLKANLEVQLQEDIGNITTRLMRDALREPD